MEPVDSAPFALCATRFAVPAYFSPVPFGIRSRRSAIRAARQFEHPGETGIHPATGFHIARVRSIREPCAIERSLVPKRSPNDRPRPWLASPARSRDAPSARRRVNPHPPPMTEIFVTTVVIAVLGVPFILLWWKIADQWADEEHRRLGRAKPPEGPAPRVVRGFDAPTGTQRVASPERPAAESMEDRRAP